jgi:hypothetical protein
MPKYIKLFESFISEGANDPMTKFADTGKVKWTDYLQLFKLSNKKLGKMMAITNAAQIAKTGSNIVAMLTISDNTVNSKLKAIGGTAVVEQSGKLSALPNGEPDYVFSARYGFKVTEQDGAAKLDAISDILDGVNSTGSAGSAGKAGTSGSAGTAADKMFGAAASAGFDKAMQAAGVQQVAAYLRMINDPALQAAAGQDATIKTLLDAQASAATPAEKDTKEKEIEPKVKAALTAKLVQAQSEYRATQDLNLQKQAQDKAMQLDSLLKNYKPQFGAALNVGSAGTSGSAGTAAKK